MAKHITIDEEEQFVTITPGPLTRVDILDYNTLLRAHAYAKLHTDDTYDEQFGINLAYTRALHRLTGKISSYLVKNA
jgi:hypothetical protein